MTNLSVSNHAAIRMDQRCFHLQDEALIAQVATEVEDGLLFLESDYQALESEVKRFLERGRRLVGLVFPAKEYQEIERKVKKFLDHCSRLQGKLLIIRNGRVVTAYRATPKQQKRLLRGAKRSGLK